MNEKRQPGRDSTPAEVRAELVAALIEQHHLIHRLEALLDAEIEPSPTVSAAQRVRQELDMEPEL